MTSTETIFIVGNNFFKSSCEVMIIQFLGFRLGLSVNVRAGVIGNTIFRYLFARKKRPQLIK